MAAWRARQRVEFPGARVRKACDEAVCTRAATRPHWWRSPYSFRSRPDLLSAPALYIKPPPPPRGAPPFPDPVLVALTKKPTSSLPSGDASHLQARERESGEAAERALGGQFWFPMAAAAAAVVVAEGDDLDQVTVRAAQILVSLRSRKLRAWPEWVPRPEAEAEAELLPEGWAGRRPRSRGRRRGSCVPWRKALRELDLAGSGGEGRYAAPAAAGSGSPSTSSAGRAAPTTQPWPSHAGGKAEEKTLSSAAAAAAKEPMAASSPDTPLDYGAGGSRASSSGDDAARPPAKRKGPGARGSGGGASSGGDDEGCSSPAKRALAAADGMDPIPTSMQCETSASSAKGFAIDLNLPPPSDDGTCPDA